MTFIRHCSWCLIAASLDCMSTDIDRRLNFVGNNKEEEKNNNNTSQLCSVHCALHCSPFIFSMAIVCTLHMHRESVFDWWIRWGLLIKNLHLHTNSGTNVIEKKKKRINLFHLMYIIEDCVVPWINHCFDFVVQVCLYHESKCTQKSEWVLMQLTRFSRANTVIQVDRKVLNVPHH